MSPLAVNLFYLYLENGADNNSGDIQEWEVCIGLLIRSSALWSKALNQLLTFISLRAQGPSGTVKSMCNFHRIALVKALSVMPEADALTCRIFKVSRLQSSSCTHHIVPVPSRHNSESITACRPVVCENRTQLHSVCFQCSVVPSPSDVMPYSFWEAVLGWLLCFWKLGKLLVLML